MVLWNVRSNDIQHDEMWEIELCVLDMWYVLVCTILSLGSTYPHHPKKKSYDHVRLFKHTNQLSYLQIKQKMLLHYKGRSLLSNQYWISVKVNLLSLVLFWDADTISLSKTIVHDRFSVLLASLHWGPVLLLFYSILIEL